MDEKNLPTIPGFYSGENPANYEQKCPLVLVLDVSSSMYGTPIDELNKGLKVFQVQIQNDEVAAARLETAIITFGEGVQCIRDFSLFENNSIQDLSASGYTPMAEAVSLAIELITERKEWYRQRGLQFYRPYIVLMTDGEPTSSVVDIKNMISAVHSGVANKKFNFWAFGTKGANMHFLKQLSSPTFPPQQLTGVNFREFFQWLSASMAIISKSKAGDRINVEPKPGENPFQITIE
jgi:uncharacterized protein YegL